MGGVLVKGQHVHATDGTACGCADAVGALNAIRRRVVPQTRWVIDAGSTRRATCTKAFICIIIDVGRLVAIGLAKMVELLRKHIEIGDLDG